MDTQQQWDTVIKAKSGFFDLPVRELIRYRDLILLFVRRDFVANFKQTILGPLWYFLQPIFTTVIFTIVFGNIARIKTDDIPGPLFYMTGITVWNFFSTCFTSNSNVFTANSHIFGKVYFPRLVMPISYTLSSFIRFFIQFLLFLGFYFYYMVIGTPLSPNLYLLLLPLVLIQVSIIAFGIGILISSLTTKYRDLQFLVGFGLQLWMYATPIVYPMSMVPEKLKWVIFLNPVSYTVEFFRYAFIGAGTIRPVDVLTSLGVTVFFLLMGLLMFTRVEKSFMDKV